MAKFPNACPACHGPLVAARLACDTCDAAVEGKFELPPMLQLSDEDQLFAAQFILCSGNLKQLASVRGQSYPTLRARLDQLIERLQSVQQPQGKQRLEILDAVAKGKLSVTEAIELLRES